MSKRPIDLAVLVSGGGRTLQNLIEQIASGALNARITTVIASRPNLPAEQKAAAAALDYKVIDKRDFASVAEYSEKIFEQIDTSGADLVCLAGWLSLIEIPDRYEHRVMNIHPALLPSFGGKSMYGLKVHEAVLRSGATESGCTVHFVDNAYDTGPMILQKRCQVLTSDTPGDLAQRVFELEKRAYPEAIKLFAEGKLYVDRGRVKIKSKD